ncbi:MAG TPA: rRNA maturation RNase YbeY [Chloroflexota bacterium]|nr:rRNA maturation RNase YbeY [Chloroflexota bacterium]
MSLPRPDTAAVTVVGVDFSVADEVSATWDTVRVKALVGAIVAGEFTRGGAFTVSLHLVTDASIQALNASHRATDAATDVLSFPLQDAHDPGGFVLPPGQPVHLGDVVVSYPRAVQQAADYGHSIEREVAYLVAHGVLHVLGYDHEADAEREHMRYLEEEALRPLGFTR